MKKIIAAILSLALVAVSAVPVAAVACDPGRASNATDAFVEWLDLEPNYLSEIRGFIEEDAPFLENDQWELQYIELNNVSLGQDTYVMRVGLQYREGFAPRIFVGGYGITTSYHPYAANLDSINPRITTFQDQAGVRYWTFWNGGTFLREVSFATGRWTPNAAVTAVRSSNQGSQIVGNIGNVAYFSGMELKNADRIGIGAFDPQTYFVSNYPGAKGEEPDHDTWTRDNCP